jgi:DNA polymerase III subunit gamma/tau
LQLTLDLFKDLQYSLQPRLHLELGLLKLVHVGKLLPIEEALAGMSGTPAKSLPLPQTPKSAASAPVRTGPSPFAADSARKAAAPPSLQPAKAATLAAAAAPPHTGSDGDLKSKLYTALMDLSMAFTADALEHSQVLEAADGITLITPKEYSLSMTEADMRKAAQHALGKPVRVKITFGEPAVSQSAGVLKAKSAIGEEEVSRRALSHPGVQRFQELFPDAQVRAVRNLKE